MSVFSKVGDFLFGKPPEVGDDQWQKYTEAMLGAADKQAGAAQDLWRQQTQANRPNISTPFGFQNWSQGPNGDWSLQAGLSGPLAQAQQGLMGQAQGALGNPFDTSALGALGTGDSARNQAIESAYGQMESRLNPQWEQREKGLEAKLAAQGLTAGSEAYDTAFANLGRERNDAYAGALANAVGQGTAAGNSVFQNNLLSRQQGLAEMLRQRELPLQELSALQGFGAMPSFMGAGAAQAPQYLSAYGQGADQAFGAYNARNQAGADLMGGLFGLGTAAMFLSDQRLKRDIRRLKVEAAPGVPWTLWRWKKGAGAKGFFVGVIAQDLARVLPTLVQTGDDGFLRVPARFAPRRLTHG